MTPPTLAAQPRLTASGKFFRLGGAKFYPKGITYGPFRPGVSGQPFLERSETERDFELARRLGANLLRVYHVPPRWLLDLAAQYGLKLLIDIPWGKHLCFLDSPALQEQARDGGARCGAKLRPPSRCFRLQRGQRTAAGHRALERRGSDGGFSRRIGGRGQGRGSRMPRALLAIIRRRSFLHPQNIDFLCFNVYLHQQRPFENYLARLQMMSDSKPLMLGEIGIDSIREGEDQQVRNARLAD